MARRMFGGWGISTDGLTLAIIADLGAGEALVDRALDAAGTGPVGQRDEDVHAAGAELTLQQLDRRLGGVGGAHRQGRGLDDLAVVDAVLQERHCLGLPAQRLEPAALRDVGLRERPRQPDILGIRLLQL